MFKKNHKKKTKFLKNHSKSTKKNSENIKKNKKTKTPKTYKKNKKTKTPKTYKKKQKKQKNKNIQTPVSSTDFLKGSRASLGSSIPMNSDDEGSLNEYGDIDAGKFGEDGEFWGGFGCWWFKGRIIILFVFFSVFFVFFSVFFWFF